MSRRGPFLLAALSAVALAACTARATRVAVPAPPSPTLAATLVPAAATAPATAGAAVAVITAAPAASATPSPTPEPTPTPPPQARQLTTGGCCVQPAWSPDGSQVWYLDRPNSVAPSGLWAVPAEGGAAPQFVTDRLGLYSPDRTLLAYPAGGDTFIERLVGDGTGERWPVGNGGRPVDFSPDGTRLAWQTASTARNFDNRVVSIWLANVDGTSRQVVAELTGGGLAGWFPDGQRLLVTRRDLAADVVELAALDLATGSVASIAREYQLRGTLLSPAGEWLAYQVTFSGDPARDGLWVARTDGTGARRLELYGAYRWRAEGRLLVVPLEPGAGSQRLVEFDAATGTGRPLTDPAQTPLTIANGDWSLSPDGRRFVFVNAADRNLWMLDLPE